MMMGIFVFIEVFSWCPVSGCTGQDNQIWSDLTHQATGATWHTPPCLVQGLEVNASIEFELCYNAKISNYQKIRKLIVNNFFSVIVSIITSLLLFSEAVPMHPVFYVVSLNWKALTFHYVKLVSKYKLLSHNTFTI